MCISRLEAKKINFFFFLMNRNIKEQYSIACWLGISGLYPFPCLPLGILILQKETSMYMLSHWKTLSFLLILSISSLYLLMRVKGKLNFANLP